MGKKLRDGSFQATSKAKKDLEPLSLASIQYISGMMQLFTETFETEETAKEPSRSRKKAIRANAISQ